MAPLTQSYVHGASPTPLSGETIGRLLRRVVLEGPDRLALVTRHQDVRWTYADLLRRSEDLAIGLRALGLQRGDRVGIWSANVSEWVLAQFGTALAGFILVNINPAYRVHEFEYALRKSGCRALILSPGHKSNDEPLRRADHARAVGDAREIAQHHAEAMVVRHRNAQPVLGRQPQRLADEIAVVDDVMMSERREARDRHPAGSGQ